MAKKVEKYNPRTYMELSIEEMLKSKKEPRPDGKVPPQVGAILLFPDGKIERAHRGELRDGDHAEFTLLERKLGDKKLDDCILFTTLEPCVERNSPKIACCKRTSKARIKTVYVGITDPDYTVDGKGIKHLEDHGVEIIMFDRDLQKRIEDENKDFIRQANERKQKKTEDDFSIPYEKPLKNADLSKLSDEALQKFISESKLKYNVSDAEFHEYLEDVGVIQFDTADKIYRPNSFGILLFGKNPRSIFKQSALMASVEYGNNKIEPQTFDQPLVLIPDLVEQWLFKVLPLNKDTSSFKRKDIAEFPVKVLREAIINAIVHRDYTLEGIKSSIEIYDNKIIVNSPGALAPSISISQLNSFRAPSISRNPIITYVFSLMNYVEEKGFGMRILRSLQEEYGLPLPEYTYNDPYLSLSFPRNMNAVADVYNNEAIKELNDEELRGFEYVKLKVEISKKEYAAHFGFDDKKALRHLAKMKELGLIKDNGEAPNSPNYKYVVA